MAVIFTDVLQCTIMILGAFVLAIMSKFMSAANTVVYVLL